MKRKRATTSAATYQRRLRGLLRSLPRSQVVPIPPGQERVYFMIEAIFQADATRKQAAAAMASLKEEYLDLNELRVSPVRDIVECVGRDMPDARQKAEMTVAALNNVFFRVNGVSLDYLEQVPSRELKRSLLELGLSPYAAACVALHVFGVHAVPVDWTLVESLKLGGYVRGDSAVTDVRRALERIILPKNAAAASAFLKAHAEKLAKHLPPKPQEEPLAVEAEQQFPTEVVAHAPPPQVHQQRGAGDAVPARPSPKKAAAPKAPPAKMPEAASKPSRPPRRGGPAPAKGPARRR